LRISELIVIVLDVKLNSLLASTEVKTENSKVVIFVKIIKEKKLMKLLKNKIMG